MLIEYSGNVTVKIDGIAASAASVIAMAGTKVLMSPVSQLMIHNPMTVAWGNQAEMERAIAMLSSVKDSIINAYELKTNLSRAKISHLMDAETWMDSGKALELGFIDGVLLRETDPTPSENICTNPTAFSQVQISNSLMDKIAKKCVIEQKQTEETNTVKADFLMDRLNLIKNWR